MGKTDDEIQLKLGITATEARNEIDALQKKIQGLNDKLSQSKKGTDEYIDAFKELKTSEQRLKKLTEAFDVNGLTIKQLTALQKRLRSETIGLVPDTDAFIQKTKELDAVKKRLAELKNGTADVRKEMTATASTTSTSVASSSSGLLGTMTKANLLATVIEKGIQLVPQYISAQAKLSDTLADIRKTTNMTESSVARLNEEFLRMNTRTAVEELRNIAVVAGQLGIPEKDILEFTKAVDELVVALGDEFTGGAQQVTKEMGALRNIFTDIRTDNPAQDMLHIGNAINKLGAEGAATGPVMADMSSRIGGVGITLGLTAGQVLGLSATMEEMNITAERGGTAVVKILQKMAAAPEEFYKVTDLGAKEFKEMVDKDLYGAFMKVVEGSKKSGDSATRMASLLKELDVDGSGASEVFAKLGGNTELLTKRVTSATQALKETDSIMGEFAIKNETLAAKLEKIGKAFANMFNFSGANAGIEMMVNMVAKLVVPTNLYSDALRREQDELQMASIKILSLNVGTEERTRLIKELQERYPDYLKNINAETVGNTDLKRALDAVNKSLVNKILLEEENEKVEEQLRVSASKRRAMDDQELVVQQKINEFFKQQSKTGKELAGLKELQNKITSQSIALDKQYDFILQEQAAGRLKGISKSNGALLDLQTATKKLTDAEAAYNKEFEKANDLGKEREALKKRLGLDKDEAAANAAAAKAKKDSDAALRKAEADRLRQELEAKQREYIEAERRITDVRLANLNDEYTRRRAIAKEQAERDIADFKGTDDQKARYEKERKQQLSGELLAINREQAKKAEDLEEELRQKRIKSARQVIDAEIAAEQDGYTRAIKTAQEKSRRLIEDFKGSEKEREAYAKTVEENTGREIFKISVDWYNKMNASLRAKRKKDKEDEAKERQEAEKKALDDAVTSAELELLLVEKVKGKTTRSKQLQQQLKEQRTAELANTELTEKEREAIEQKYKKLSKAFRIQADASESDAKIALLSAQMAKELAAHKDNEKQKALITAKYLSEIQDIKDKQLDKEFKDAQERVQQYLDALSVVVSAINDFSSINTENQFIELDRLKQYQDQQYEYSNQKINAQLQDEEAAKNSRLSKAEQEKNALIAKAKAQYDNKKISEKEYNRLREKAETDYNELKTNEDNAYTANKEANEKRLANEKQKIDDDYNKRQRELKIKQWQSDQQAKLTQAMMEGALAMVRVADNPFMQVVVGLTTAINMAKIDAAEMPVFRDGGVFDPVAGVAKGASHENGGINMVDGSSGKVLGQMEGGEPYMILSKNTYANNKEIIDALIDSSLYRGGASVMQKSATPMYENGAVLGSVPRNEAAAPAVADYSSLMISVLNQILDVLRNPKPAKAILDFNQFHEDYTRALNTIEEANV